MTKRDWVLAALAGGIILLFRQRPVIEESQADTAPSSPFPTTDPGSMLVPSHCPIRPAVTASTPHFALWEFHSKDGVMVPELVRGNIQLLMQQLEVIREAAGGRSVQITSGYRSPEHNRRVGGVKSSLHLCGMAADIQIAGLTPGEVQDLVLDLMARGKVIDGGLGRYNTFTHYDIGPRRRWDYRKR